MSWVLWRCSSSSTASTVECAGGDWGGLKLLTGTLKGRVWAFILYALAQVRVATDRFSGVMHLSVFWGMVVLFFGTILATVDWDVTRPLLGFRFLQGNFYLGYELLLDIFGIFALVGLALALYRRYILRAPRLKSETLPTLSGTTPTCWGCCW